jgi:hypothetical protein
MVSKSADPMVGTWKVDLSKSTYSPGPAPKSAVNKFEPWEDGMKATIDIVDAQSTLEPPLNSMARTTPSRGLRLLTRFPSRGPMKGRPTLSGREVGKPS